MSLANGSSVESKATAIGLESVARRRTLLKGLGKASAIAGAAVPLRSLATDKQNMRLAKSGKMYMCTLSGQNSVVHSASAAYTTDCKAKPIDWYKGASYPNWPLHWSTSRPGCNNGAKFCYATSDSFTSVFGSGSITHGARMVGTLVNSYATSDEAHWVIALLNANTQATNFPFSPAEVVALFANTTKRASAIALFRSIEAVA